MLLMAKKSERKQVGPTVQLSIRMNRVLFRRLLKLGEPFGTKQSQLIHRAVEEYVIRHERDHAQTLPD